MRLTIRLDKEVYTAARAIAAEKGTSVGEAVNDLARAGLPRRDSAVDYIPMSEPMGMKVECIKVSEILDLEDRERLGRRVQ